MRIFLKFCCLFWVALSAAASANAQNSTSEWNGIDRIVAVGDIHGDFAAFRKLLIETGIINKRNRWIAGETHFVQVGDVPDRGPDSRKAMDLLMKLEKQALKAGGRVHALIGSHEAMNVAGDLRYVDAGEYKAFVDRKSRRRREAFYQNTIKYLQDTQEPENLPVFDENYKAQWLARYPLGYVEHRLAWSPQGKYGQWVLGHNTAIKINDTLFVHGGISPQYQERSLDELNTTIRTELAQGETIADTATVNDQLGPLWYRGLSGVEETCQTQQQLEALLAVQQAKRIVVAHTPNAGVVLARYGARVIVVDVGLSAHYGGARAALIIEGDKISVMHQGQRLEPLMPVSVYLKQAADATVEAVPMFETFVKRMTGVDLDLALNCNVPEAVAPEPTMPGT